jgi:hypothetical protein
VLLHVCYVQVKVSVAGAQLLPCKPLPQERSSILQLPALLGSLGAISVAASSCQKPAAAKPGSKMLSLSLAVGQLELSAAGQASSSGSQPAAVFTLPGVAGSMHLAKVPGVGLQPASRTGSGAGTGTPGGGRSSNPGREGLRLRQHAAQSEQSQQQQGNTQQQQQQQWVLKATCNCQLKQQPQLQLHAAQLPPLLRSVQLLQVSLRELKAQRQAAAQAAAAAAAVSQAGEPSLDEQLPQVVLSPAASLSSLPRPETPSLLTPCMSPSPHPTSPPESAGGASTPAAGAQAAGPDSETAAAAAMSGGGADDVASRRSLASFGSGVLQRLPSKLFGAMQGGNVADAQLGVMAELSVVTEAGLSVEVTDSKGEVSLWLSMQEVEAGAAAEWVPGDSSTASSSRRSFDYKQEQGGQGSLQLSAHALLQQLVVSVAPCTELAAVQASPAAAGKGRLPLHKLVQLDSASVQVSSSSEAEEPASMRGRLSGPDAASQPPRQPLPLQLLALAGRLQVAASVAALQPLLALAQQVYQPVHTRPSSAGGVGLSAGSASGPAGDSLQQSGLHAAAMAAVAGPHKAKKKAKAKAVVLAVVEVQLQSCEVSVTHGLPVSSAFATEAAKQAAEAGVQVQLLLSVSGTQLSVLPLQQQLGASVELLQVGYKAVGSTGAPAPSQLQLEQQSVELLLVKGVHLRQYHAEGLQLLKVAVQQLRSDNHVDVVLSGVAVASAVLQQGLSGVQQLQLRRAAAAAAAASQQAAAEAVAAAASRDPQAAQEAAAVAASIAAALDEQGLIRGDSFSALAVQPILDGISAGTDGEGAPLASGPSGSAALPPVSRPGSSSGSLRAAAPRPAKQKPVLALEARVCDLAVQLSVCESDALMVQMEQLNYSSVLEQAVICRLRFAINERSVAQVPHAAVHNVPGWLPPGVTAAAAAAAAAAPQRTQGFARSVDGRAGFAANSDTGQSAAGAPPSDAGLDAADMQQQPHQQQGPPGASASWPDSHAGEAGAMTSLAFLDSPLPCSCLGSRRPAADADPALYQRQAARQAAGRERCKVPAEAQPAAAAGGADAGATAGGSSINFSRSADAGAGAAAASAAVISLDVYAERVLLSIPHDEAPGRIIVVCETWAKAVKEVSWCCWRHTCRGS